jgi:hypothetical protein
MPSLLEAILLVLAPFAPPFSRCVWFHAEVLLLGAILLPRVRPMTAAVQVMGLLVEGRLTNDHRVLHRATWSARQGTCGSQTAGSPTASALMPCEPHIHVCRIDTRRCPAAGSRGEMSSRRDGTGAHKVQGHPR